MAPGTETVRGDVLTLSDLEAALPILDGLEEHPGVYRREVVDVTYDDGSRDRAYAYLIAPGSAPGGRWIPSGDWLREDPGSQGNYGGQ